MMKRKKRLLMMGVLALILVAVSHTGSCARQELPPPLTAEERAKVQHTYFDYTVGLERPKRPDRWDAEAPLIALRGTGLFKAVDYLDRLSSPPDLIAQGDTIIRGTPTIPFATILTLGIVPTKVQEGWGYWFSFHAPNSSESTSEISFSYKGTTILGGTSGSLSRSPDWTEDSPIKSQRLYDRLALEIAAKSEEIRRLVKNKPN